MAGRVTCGSIPRMSAATSRASRRDIRRAVGAQLDQHLKDMAEAMQQFARALKDLTTRVEALEQAGDVTTLSDLLCGPRDGQ